MARRTGLVKGQRIEKTAQPLFVNIHTSERLPLVAFGYSHRFLEICHLLNIHKSRVIVLMAGERQAKALDGVNDKAMRHIAIYCVQRLQHRLHVMACEIGHQVLERIIAIIIDQRAHALSPTDIAQQPFPPRCTTFEGERAVELVGAIVNPFAQRVATGALESRLLQFAVFQNDNLPADRQEEIFDLLKQLVRNNAVKALAIIVDHPPQVSHIMLPAFKQGLVDITFIKFGIAHNGYHARRLFLFRYHFVKLDIVADHRCKHCEANAEPDRAGRDIDIVTVLSTGRIGLGAAEGAELFELFARLIAEEILNGVVYWRCVRLHRHAVLWPQDIKI